MLFGPVKTERCHLLSNCFAKLSGLTILSLASAERAKSVAPRVINDDSLLASVDLLILADYAILIAKLVFYYNSLKPYTTLNHRLILFLKT